MKLFGWFIVAVAAIACGCAQPAKQFATTAPATTMPLSAEAMLSLDEIEPRPILPTTRPSTQPAPLEALVLYARARDEQANRQRATAISLLERALRIDPDSFEINYILGRAYQGNAGSAEQALSAFRRAATINPNNLEVQAELGRVYQVRGNKDKAIEQFRLAMQTEQYKAGEVRAAVVDYHLAVLLEQNGYDRAALECYTRLADRLEHPRPGARENAEVALLMSQPELVYRQIGSLQEKLGKYNEALATYLRSTQIAPDDVESQSRVVRVLLKLDRPADALKAAADVVRAAQATPASIRLLEDVYGQTGDRRSFAEALTALQRQNPNDHALLFALAEVLAAAGKFPEVDQLMWKGIESQKGDVDVVLRLCRVYSDRDMVSETARLIIRASAAFPNITGELQSAFIELIRLWRKNSLRLAALQKLEVPAQANVAKQYWIWRLASESSWSRPTTARVALEQSATGMPVFDPACRALLATHQRRSDWDDAAKQRAIESLIDSVRSRGRPDLAAELRGVIAFTAGQNDLAQQSFAEAIRMTGKTGPGPDLQLENALVVLRKGDAPKFEQLMWKLVEDYPRFGAAYELLLGYYENGNAFGQAWTVLNAWLSVDPNNVGARFKLIDSLIAMERRDDALGQMRKLFDEQPDNPMVVVNMISLFESARMQRQVTELLEAERVRHPSNRVAIQFLVDLYAKQGRMNDATRVIQAARAAVSDDPDLLYYIGNLYHSIDQPQQTEEVLQEVLKLDPKHPQAGNDLGYGWADSGKNIERAESLIRIAVDAEPDNPSYLDSLGWVLYKRGQFDQAIKWLREASEPEEQADPIVLDHLGDALYRQGQADQAKAVWERSLTRIGPQPNRKDLQELRGQLQTKLRQVQASQPVRVAPVVETGPAR